jgi:membrane-bound inhibitor of C-type lysozyme
MERLCLRLPISIAAMSIATMLLAAGCADEEGTTSKEEQASEDKLPIVFGRPGKTFVYQCGDESTITARVEGETAWLFLRSGTVSLPQVQSASGAKHSDGVISYWSKGEEASLERPGQESISCTNNRAEAIWEDAKLRGADFRGTGNEPGWYMEISQAYGIVFVTNYGSDRYHFEKFDSTSDEASRTTKFEASKGGHDLTVLLEGKSCMDSMSGAQFATKVTVTLDATTLNGCGRALH